MCCIKKITVFLFGLLFIPTAFSQINVIPDSLASIQDTDSLHTLRKNGVKAATYVFATNIGVWTFDRFILDGSFARINLSTMKENIKTGFVWDNDMFSTNLFAHPYHGGTYFNSARSNGMNFWQSVPYAVGGSLMWEYLMENEPGALSRVIGLFSQRNYNIESLTVAPTEDASLSRMTIVTSGSDDIVEQITKQLNKLVEVVKVVDLSESAHIERELMLIKVRAAGKDREEIKRMADIFRGRIIDVTDTTYVIELTGTQAKLDSFVSALDAGLILETVRSGICGVARGDRVLKV